MFAAPRAVPARAARFPRARGGNDTGMTRPTETPPAEGSTGMAMHEHANDANSGPVAGNRTPMAFGLAGIAVVLVAVLAVVAYALVRLLA